MRNAARRLDGQLRRSRLVLFTVLPLAAAASAGLMDTIQPGLRLLYIVLGFSLIIFLHELGHFIVARLCSVKCLAFSIGIGPRLFGWRKNGTLSFGSDPYDPDSKKHKHSATDAAAVQSDLPTAATDPRHAPTVGDCDYRLSWLPLGGYVRMLGQDDMDPTKVSTDPNAFNRRPIWQRMCIVSAGVIMNVIFAAVCFSIIFSPGIGVDFPPAKVGSVSYNMPAWGQLHLGDQIVSINGEKPLGFLEFTDVMMKAALAETDQQITLDVIPYGAAPNSPPVPVTLVPKHSDVSGFLAFGIEAMPGLKIGGTGADYTDGDAEKAYGHQVTFEANKAELNRLTDDGWKITGVDGIDLRDAPEPNATHDKYVLLYNHVNARNGQAVDLSLVNVKTHATKQMKLLPHIEYVPGETKYPTVFGMAPQVLVARTEAGSPADKAGIKAGDRILRVGDRVAPDYDQVLEIIGRSGGNALDIDVERAAAPSGARAATAPQGAEPGAAREIKTVHVAARKNKTGRYVIGIAPYQDLRSTRFVVPALDSAAGTLGLGSDATIAAIDGQAVKNWQDIYAALRAKSPEAQVPVSFHTGQSAEPLVRTFTLSPAESELVKEHLHFMLGLHLENETRTQRADNAGQAVFMGLDHTKKFILNVYLTLAGLFRGTVDASNLHGIVGITKVGYDVQERGPVWLWYVLAMVSVNLAVANFLPLPIVDGGLFLLLIVEKIRGKPLSLKVQSAIQTAGIVLLASLFLFVTWNDIKLF
jgi:regulator of sigma E protease